MFAKDLSMCWTDKNEDDINQLNEICQKYNMKLNDKEKKSNALTHVQKKRYSGSHLSSNMLITTQHCIALDRELRKWCIESGINIKTSPVLTLHVC